MRTPFPPCMLIALGATIANPTFAASDAQSAAGAAAASRLSLLVDESKAMAAGAEAPEKGPVAQSADDSAGLAKKLSNPVSDLISVPFQFNYDDGFGPKDGGRITLNIQPVIPFSISENWNLITRTIVPVIYQESPAASIGDESGLGDITQSFFFSPKKPVGGWILGAGPVALWPTGTNPYLRSEQFGLGPTAVALRQHDGWTYGILANHIWAITESDDHPTVNSTFLQPFLSYTFKTATSITINSESSYDWTEEEWTVPLNLMVGQIVRFGKLPVQFELGGRYYADAPDDGPEWGLRFQITFLFPE